MAAALCGVALAQAPNKDPANPAGTNQPGGEMRDTQKQAVGPQTFVKKAALAGMTEVELGKIALNKSQNPDVRSFAQRMVQDHTKANTELTSIAQAKNIEVPKSLDAEHKSMVEMMRTKSGAEFDAAYSEHMRADHSKAIELFEGASKSMDAELASFAGKTLPTLKEHKRLTTKLPANSARSTETAGAGAAPRQD
jgi:putative membrane protein